MKLNLSCLWYHSFEERSIIKSDEEEKFGNQLYGFRFIRNGIQTLFPLVLLHHKTR